MLWIALHLPRLSLEAFESTLVGTQGPVALLEDGRIGSTNAVAAALGVRAGQSRATALALAPGLLLGQADAQRNRLALLALADAALAFSPTVTVAPWAALGDGRSDATGGPGSARPPRSLPGQASTRAGLHLPGADDGEATAPTVLLEVQATLAYWGGRGEAPDLQRQRLLQRLFAALAPLKHALQVASAPTPAGAAVLALQARPWTPASPEADPALPGQPARRRTRGANRGQNRSPHPDAHPGAADGDAQQASLHAEGLSALARALDRAPVWRIGPGRAHWEALQGMGLRTLADLRALPRSGLARRFGEALLDGLDRAYGDRPDPRPLARLAERFDSAVELAQRAESVEPLLRGAEVLLNRLAAWLRAHQARTRRLTLVLLHERGRWAAELDQTGGPDTPSSTFTLALAEPSDDPVHLLGLLRERLSRVPLPAPTLDLRLLCEDRLQRPPPNGELFPSAGSQREGLNRLIERLQARLGPDGVQRPVHRDDHRPEVANALQPLALGRTGQPAGALATPPASLGAWDSHGQGLPPGRVPRPVWLLHPPEPLSDGPLGPRLGREPLQLLSGPERLETGWWDDGLAERDYFIAQTPEGVLVWIYRHRRPPEPPPADGPAHEAHAWFLQGRFG